MNIFEDIIYPAIEEINETISKDKKKIKTCQ